MYSDADAFCGDQSAYRDKKMDFISKAQSEAVLFSGLKVVSILAPFILSMSTLRHNENTQSEEVFIGWITWF